VNICDNEAILQMSALW